MVMTINARVIILSICGLLAVTALSACRGSSATLAPTPTPTLGATATSVVSPTTAVTTAASPTSAATATRGAQGSATATKPLTATATVTATSAGVTGTPTNPPATATGQTGGATSDYVDDRSGPAELITSFYNAINRREYLRAYSYWALGVAETQLPSYDAFAQGYANTDSVELTLGTITSDAGAGQLYYSVPVVLNAITTGGAKQTFAGCYQLHLSRPQIQAAPPFQPLAIVKADVNTADSGDTAGLLAQACPDQAGQPVATPTPGSAANIDASIYLDNRSTPDAVLRSLYNAINRQEYARAYSYWDATATGDQLPSFDQFQQGYAQTKSVELTTGDAASDPGAGQLNYSVPVTLVAQQRDGSSQTFVGCYRLHLSQPAIQGTPPFQPLAITAGTLQQVDNAANTADLMATACQQ